MELLKERIRKDGKIKGNDVLKVDSFLNHQMDVALFAEIGKEFKRRFADCEVNKILTIEASGIGIACIVAQYFNCPVIFAKKNQTKNTPHRWNPSLMGVSTILLWQKSFWVLVIKCC